MRILAIDPGNEFSAYAIYDRNEFLGFEKCSNDTLLAIVGTLECDVIVIERVECMGMAVGKSVFETCIWIGRFIDRALRTTHARVKTIGRRNVKMHMCGSMRAKDSNIRQAVMDRYGSTREKAIGKKKSPGPLYGASKDIWSAMAIAITSSESSDGMELYK